MNRQLNDKERVAAALENPNLLNVRAWHIQFALTCLGGIGGATLC